MSMMQKVRNTFSKKSKEKSKEGKKSKDSRAKSSDAVSGINSVQVKSTNNELGQSSSHAKAEVINSNDAADNQLSKAMAADAGFLGTKAPDSEIHVHHQDAGWEKTYPSLPKTEATVVVPQTGQFSSDQINDISKSAQVEPCLQPLHGNPTTSDNDDNALSDRLSQMNFEGGVTRSQAIRNQSDLEVREREEIMREEERNNGERERQYLEGSERERERQGEEERDGQQQEKANDKEKGKQQQERANEQQRDGQQQERTNEQQRDGQQQERTNEQQRDGQQQEREDNDHEHPPVQEEAQGSPAEPLVSSLFENHTKLVDTMCLMLLPPHALIKNWESLAYELGAPASIRTQLKRNTNHSQTRELFEMLSILKENLKVQDLINALTSLRRKDVIELLNSKVPANQRNSCITEKIQADDELMETLETMLDKESKVVKNWYYVGLKLGLNKETLQEIKDGNFRNNVGGFFEYVYSRFPILTVEGFKEIMTNIGRNDVRNFMLGVPEGPMKTSVPIDGDEMRTLCYMLSKSSCGTVKDWKHLAMELKIGYNEYKVFEKEIQENPTKLLLEWALIEKPEMTVSDLCRCLKNMKRYDVIEEVEKFYNRSFTES